MVDGVKLGAFFFFFCFSFFSGMPLMQCCHRQSTPSLVLTFFMAELIVMLLADIIHPIASGMWAVGTLKVSSIVEELAPKKS